ncbi:MAG: tetratricopeptide repeat protein [Desulfitobacteriaceae bacterium]
MNALISDRTRNTIFYILLGIAVISVSISIIIGHKQDVIYYNDYQSFQQIDSSSAPLAGELVEKYPTSFILLWKYARCLEENGNYYLAEKYLDKARVQCQFLVADLNYLIDYGNVLYYQGKYAKSRKYFSKAQEIFSNSDNAKQLTKILKDIDNKLENGR